MSHAHFDIELSDSRDCVNPPKEVKFQNQPKTSSICFLVYLFVFDIISWQLLPVDKRISMSNKIYKISKPNINDQHQRNRIGCFIRCHLPGKDPFKLKMIVVKITNCICIKYFGFYQIKILFSRKILIY